MTALSLLAALRLAISPRPPLRPTCAEIAAQTDRAAPPRPRTTGEAARPAAQWFAELEEHFPRAFLHAYASDLDQLRAVSGCTPGEAASYARIYLGAPTIAASSEGWPDRAPPVHE